MIDGVKLNLGGQDYVVPPLNLKAIKQLGAKIEAMQNVSGVMDGEQIDTATEIVLAAMQRNYPEMTADDLQDLLDLGNLRPTLAAILGQSGLKPTSGEDKAAAANQ